MDILEICLNPIRLEQAYTGVLDWPGWDTRNERDDWNTRDTFLTLLCNLARSLVIYVTTANHEDIFLDASLICSSSIIKLSTGTPP